MMQARGLRALLVVVLVGDALGHAFLKTPAPRGGTPTLTAAVPKLTPFTGVAAVVNNPATGCGDITNGIQATPGLPSATFTPGQTVPVEWTITIPHPLDNLLTGVRVALHYSATDSFAQNILAGGVTGDVGAGTVDASLLTTTITLPAGKTCDATSPCVLQWVQAAQNDGGYYLYCADITITAGGVATGAATGVATGVATGAATGGANNAGFPQQPGAQTSATGGAATGQRGYGMVGAAHRSHYAKAALTTVLTCFVMAFLHQ